MKKLSQILLATVLAASAQLATAQYNPTDLLLVIHQTGKRDVEYDLGSVSNYLGQAAGTVIPVSYSAAFASASTNFNGNFTSAKYALVAGDDASTLWLSDFSLGTVPSGFNTSGAAFNNLQGRLNNVGTLGNNVGLGNGPISLATASANSYSYLVSGGTQNSISTLGGLATGTVDGNYGTEVAFYQLTTNAPSAATLVGSFTLDNSGNLTFVAGQITPVIRSTTIANQNVDVNGTTTLSATVDGATGYQWYNQAGIIAGATNSSYVAGPGTYYVVATNATYGTSVTSGSGTITPTYTPADLLLVIHQTGKRDVEYDLGSVSNYLGQAAGTVIPVSYSAAFASASTNFNGNFTSAKYALVAGNDANTLWLSDFSLGTVPSGFNTSGAAFNNLQGRLNNVGTLGNNVGLGNGPISLATASANSYSYLVSGGTQNSISTLGGLATGTVDGNYGTEVAFYQLTTNAPSAATLVGSFTLDNSGNLTFVAGKITPVIRVPALASTNILGGSSATLTVNADGATTYQWYQNLSAIVGATNSSYTVLGAGGNEGSYRAIASNTTYGTSVTNGSTTVTITPVITTQPASLTNNAGTTATFAVVGSGASSYQWYKGVSAMTDGGNVSGSTTATLTLTSVGLADGVNYTVVLSNSSATVTSSVATLTVLDPISITAQPVSTTNNAGSTSTFSVTATAVSSLSYQWYKDASLLAGKTSSSLVVSNLTYTNNGSYAVVVSNATFGTSVTSSNATLTVVDPFIITQPISQSVKASSNATFTVVAAGGSLTYQWKQNGTNAPYVATARTASLIVTNPTVLANGYLYSVVVSNSLGQFVTSSNATLGVTASGAPIIIATQPAGLTKLQGQIAIFSVKATGAAPFTNLTYQWNLNGTPLSGATFPSYTNNFVSTNDAGNYTVTIANAVASTNSAAAVLVVNPDTTAPTAVVIVSPKTKFETNVASVLVTGTALDNARISQVFVKVGTNSFAPANVTNSATGAATWNATVSLVAGTNIVVAKAVDFGGNSLTSAPVAYFRQVASAFTVVTNTDGAGVVSIKPVELVPANYYVGRTYQITATPNSSSVLSNIINVATSGTTITVNPAPLKGLKGVSVVAEAANTVTINFETNRFIGAAGTYYGLVNASTVAKESSGFLTLKTTAKMAFSGQLTLDGDILPIAGAFNLDGVTTTKSNTVLLVTRTGKPTLTLNLQLGFDNTIGGTITNTDWVATADGDRAVFSAATPTTTYNGSYTLVLPGTPGATTSPAGNGYATIAVASTGVVKAAGALGDGDVFAPLSATVAADGRWPLFSKQAAGIVAGWVWFTNNTSDSMLIATNLYWIKEASAATYYPAGFTNAGFTGVGSVLIAANPLTFANGTNALATFTDGGLSSSLTNNLGIGALNKITVLGTNSTSLKLTYKATTGLLSGTFNGPAATAVKGVYLQSTNLQSASGYFLGTSLSGSLLVQ